MTDALVCLEHYPYSLQPGAVLHELFIEGAPGQTVNASFSLQAGKDISELAASVADLAGESSNIEASLLDLFVVKVWDQSGIGVYKCPPVKVPELLVKDDRPAIRDGYRRIYPTWKQYIKPRRVYQPPAVRLEGDVRTSIPAGSTKQFWLRVRIPTDAVPGEFSGRIAFSTGASLPVRLTVLPIVLAEPEQDLMLWFKGSLDATRLQYYIDEPEFRAQLQDIYDHGFRSISLQEYQSHYLQKALDIAHEIGFNRNVLLHAPFPPDVLSHDFHDMSPLLYMSDEIDTRGPEYITEHVEMSKAKPASARTMISLRQQSFLRRLQDPDDIGHAPDIVSYFVSDNLAYFLMMSQFPRISPEGVYYYWPTHMEKPDLHRVLAGLFLWKSRAVGISPYCYQHPPVYPNSPYDDFDYWDVGTRGDIRPLRDHMTTYPARGGSIPTIQWEGLREGISDLKYLITHQNALDAAGADPRNASIVEEAAARRDAFLARIKMPDICVMSDSDRDPYPEIEPCEYQEFRAMLARDIVALHKASLSGVRAGV